MYKHCFFPAVILEDNKALREKLDKIYLPKYEYFEIPLKDGKEGKFFFSFFLLFFPLFDWFLAFFSSFFSYTMNMHTHEIYSF
jgi:hypothetical protein